MSKKSGRKLLMLCWKANNAEGKEMARNLFRHPLGYFRYPLRIFLPPPGRNPESAPALLFPPSYRILETRITSLSSVKLTEKKTLPDYYIIICGKEEQKRVIIDGKVGNLILLFVQK